MSANSELQRKGSVSGRRLWIWPEPAQDLTSIGRLRRLQLPGRDHPARGGPEDRLGWPWCHRHPLGGDGCAQTLCCVLKSLLCCTLPGGRQSAEGNQENPVCAAASLRPTGAAVLTSTGEVSALLVLRNADFPPHPRRCALEVFPLYWFLFQLSVQEDTFAIITLFVFK